MTLNLIKLKLPPYILQNDVLDEVLGPIAASIDDFHKVSTEVQRALAVDGATGSELDAIAKDMGLVRNYNEPDIVLSLRVQNSIVTHQRRGSVLGVEQEGGEMAKVTPYVQKVVFAAGVTPVGTAGIGDIDTAWIQYWVSVPIQQSTMVQKLKEILPLHVKYGIDPINVVNPSGGYSEVAGNDFLSGGSYNGFVLDGYSLGDSNVTGLYPETPTASFTYGNIDLGANYSNYIWMADWLDIARWDVKYSANMEISFSADQNSWGPYVEYIKNQMIRGSEIKRYAKVKFTLTMTSYDKLRHYFFSKIIIKGLTLSQLMTGKSSISVDANQLIGI